MVTRVALVLLALASRRQIAPASAGRFAASVARMLCCAAMLLASAAHAAPRTIRGVVYERGSTKPIAGASVLADRGAIAVTDIDGYFTLEVTDADREVTVAANGYATRGVRIPKGEGRWSIDLEPARGSEVIEVTGKAPEETKPLSYQLTAEEIRVIPGAGNDILRAVTALPGVARIPYSFGGLVLRGMSPRDSLVQLDGIEVPLAFHFGGVTSFYPGGMLADVTLTSGGFDASVGRAQGGLISLTTREPRTDRVRMGGSIGLLDSSVQVEGPLPKGGGIIAGVRRSYIDTIVDPFVDDEFALPSYLDFQMRTTWGDPRKQLKFTPMIFASIDRVRSNELSVTSSFARVGVPLHRQWGPLGLYIVPWIGWNELSFNDKTEGLTFARPTYPGGIRAELVRDWPWGHWRGGAELSGGYLAQTQITTAGSDGPQEIAGDSTIGWTDVALWTELRYQTAEERLAIKPGVRLEVYGLTTGTPQRSSSPVVGTIGEPDGPQIVVDPRLNISQRIGDDTTFRQAIGRYHQPPTPGDVDPVNGNAGLDASYVDQMSLGLETVLPREVFASLTGFYHYGRDIGVRLRNPRPGSDEPEPNLGGLGPTFQLLLERQLGFAIYRESIGRARTAGVEVLLKRNVGGLFTMLAYTMSISQRTDDPRARATYDGVWRPFELDQRHNLQLAISKQWPNWRFGARLQIVSGNPYSPSRLTPSGDVVQDPWAGRLPTFVSLDVRADRRWHRCWGDINLYVDVQNAINYDNVEGREFDFDAMGDADIPGLPIIPFIGVEFLPLL
ncbi:MAG: hypothetical protein ACKV2T_32580 [Kofleriaceae bacterium]